MATVVLAHGAWSSAWAWKKVRPLMAAAGHQFFTPSYTGLGEREHLANPSIDLSTHINDVLGVIEAEELSDFVLMGHSYGGMVATGVAVKIPQRISQLIYLDAFVPRNGQSLSDLVPPAQAQKMKENTAKNDGWRLPPNPTPPDTPPEDAAWVITSPAAAAVEMFRAEARICRRAFDAARLYPVHALSGWAVRPVCQARQER